MELARKLSDTKISVDAIQRLRTDEDKTSSKIKLKALPFTAHYTASGTTSPHGSKTWLNSHYGTANDLSDTVATHGTNTFCAGKTSLE
jgi:hypothetical protein